MKHIRKLLAGAAVAAIMAATLLPQRVGDMITADYALGMMFIMIDEGTPSPSYRNSYSTTSNSANYSFASCDLGTPHSSRMVVCIAIADDVDVTALTVDGTSATNVITFSQGGRSISMWRAASTANATGTITFTNTSANSAIVHVYALYPSSQTPVDTGSGGNASSPLTVSDIAKTNGGFTIMGVVHNGTNPGAFTQNGAETIVENYDGVYEASTSSSVAASHVNTATTTTDDYTFTTTSPSGIGFVIASWF